MSVPGFVPGFERRRIRGLIQRLLRRLLAMAGIVAWPPPLARLPVQELHSVEVGILFFHRCELSQLA